MKKITVQVKHDELLLACKDHGSHTSVFVCAKPGSAKEGIFGAQEGYLIMRINAIREGGKANERLMEVLAHVLGIAKSHCSIVRGLSASKKEFYVQLQKSDVIFRIMNFDDK